MNQLFTGIIKNPYLQNWVWKYILTPFLVGIFFGIGNFGAYYLCQTKYVKYFEDKFFELVN